MTVTTAEGNSATYTASGSTGDDPGVSIVLTNKSNNLNFTVRRARPNTSYYVRIESDCSTGRPTCDANPSAIPAVSTYLTTDGNGNWGEAANGKFYNFGDNIRAVLVENGTERARSDWVKF